MQDQRMKASESVEMFQQLLKITQVEHLLQHHKLNQAEFMELSNQGATLIMTLFTDVHLCEKPGTVAMEEQVIRLRIME